MKTIRELAEGLHVSKQSIFKTIDSLGLRSRLTVDGKRLMVDDDTERLIVEAFNERRRPSTKQEKLTAVDVNRQPVDWQRLMTAKDEQIAEKDRQIASLLASVTRLQEQAEETARQHSETVERLTGTIESLSSSLKAAQALHAASVVERIETKEEEAPEKTIPETEQPRRWWQFWK